MVSFLSGIFLNNTSSFHVAIPIRCKVFVFYYLEPHAAMICICISLKLSNVFHVTPYRISVTLRCIVLSCQAYYSRTSHFHHTGARSRHVLKWTPYKFTTSCDRLISSQLNLIPVPKPEFKFRSLNCKLTSVKQVDYSGFFHSLMYIVFWFSCHIFHFIGLFCSGFVWRIEFWM